MPQWSPQPYGFGPPAKTGTNGLAIASLVLSIIWLAGLGSIAGIVLGIVALRQVNRTGQGGRGLAIAGISVGAATLALAVVVAMPVYLNQQRKGADAETKSALRDAATAEEVFFTDHEVYAPTLPDLQNSGLSVPAGVSMRIYLTPHRDDYCLEANQSNDAGRIWRWVGSRPELDLGRCT
ncbi:MAG: DUF4190 domain-containing protein [Mycobacteriales bacterium]|nr:DUF4190 domain-containing protein [Frankia sp.]